MYILVSNKIILLLIPTKAKPPNVSRAFAMDMRLWLQKLSAMQLHEKRKMLSTLLVLIPQMQ